MFLGCHAFLLWLWNSFIQALFLFNLFIFLAKVILYVKLFLRLAVYLQSPYRPPMQFGI